jgi:uncharacterized protein (TIGR03000 family)
VVRLPAQAKLMINRTATRSGSATREFVSPPLKPGKAFHYTLKADLVRDGRTMTATVRVAVRAGEQREVALTFPPEGGVTRK